MSNNLLSWDRKPSENFVPGWFIGSDDSDGRHLRDLSGWPYSVYRKSTAIGGCDIVLCHGIQNLTDARELLEMLNLR